MFNGNSVERKIVNRNTYGGHELDYKQLHRQKNVLLVAFAVL